MGAPCKLVDINVWVNGGSWQGVASEFEEPKLTIETEDWRGGGMPGPVKLFKNVGAFEGTLTMAGLAPGLVSTFGATDLEGARLRLVGAYRADDGTPARMAEIYIGGRFTEIDFGTSKAGDMTAHKYSYAASYYRRIVDGFEEIAYDAMNGVFRVFGNDRYAEIMVILMG
jgi:P2 family phage contractile tail tube protein